MPNDPLAEEQSERGYWLLLEPLSLRAGLLGFLLGFVWLD